MRKIRQTKDQGAAYQNLSPSRLNFPLKLNIKYEVMKDCKCFLILFSLFVIMLNKLIIFLSQDLEHHLKIVEDRMEKWKKDHWMRIGEDMNFSTDRLQDIWILENERARVLYNSDEADDN